VGNLVVLERKWREVGAFLKAQFAIQILNSADCQGGSFSGDFLIFNKH